VVLLPESGLGPAVRDPEDGLITGEPVSNIFFGLLLDGSK
jgi:hypothetical protein